MSLHLNWQLHFTTKDCLSVALGLLSPNHLESNSLPAEISLRIALGRPSPNHLESSSHPAEISFKTTAKPPRKQFPSNQNQQHCASGTVLTQYDSGSHTTLTG